MPCKKKKATYICSKCGYTSSKQGKCCGAPMKKVMK